MNTCSFLCSFSIYSLYSATGEEEKNRSCTEKIRKSEKEESNETGTGREN